MMLPLSLSQLEQRFPNILQVESEACFGDMAAGRISILWNRTRQHRTDPWMNITALFDLKKLEKILEDAQDEYLGWSVVRRSCIFTSKKIPNDLGKWAKSKLKSAIKRKTKTIKAAESRVMDLVKVRKSMCKIYESLGGNLDDLG